MDDQTCGGANSGRTGTDLNARTNGIRIPECWVNPSCRVPTINYLRGCVGRTALHEIGHGLGFLHENERPDAPTSGAGTSCRQVDGATGTKQRYGQYNCNIEYVPGVPTCSPMWSGNSAAKHPLVSTFDCVDPQSCHPGGNCSLDITPGDIAAIQRTYGRRQPGALVSTNGRCAAVYGTTVGNDAYMWDCDEGPANASFIYSRISQVLRVAGNSLYLGTANSASGSAVEIRTDASVAGATWAFKNVAIRGWGGLCLDLSQGNTNGGLVRLWACDEISGVNQKWTVTPASEIRFGNTNSCLTVPSSGTGQLYVTACANISRQKFRFGTSTSSSQQNIISQAFSTKCLDSQGWYDSDYTNGFGLPLNGQAINLIPCNNVQFNQKFNFTGALVNGHGLCLDRGSADNGSALTQRPCTGGEAQLFDYYLRTEP
jgi:hypothetical protein